MYIFYQYQSMINNGVLYKHTLYILINKFYFLYFTFLMCDVPFDGKIRTIFFILCEGGPLVAGKIRTTFFTLCKKWKIKYKK